MGCASSSSKSAGQETLAGQYVAYCRSLHRRPVRAIVNALHASDAAQSDGTHALRFNDTELNDADVVALCGFFRSHHAAFDVLDICGNNALTNLAAVALADAAREQGWGSKVTLHVAPTDGGLNDTGLATLGGAFASLVRAPYEPPAPAPPSPRDDEHAQLAASASHDDARGSDTQADGGSDAGAAGAAPPAAGSNSSSSVAGGDDADQAQRQSVRMSRGPGSQAAPAGPAPVSASSISPTASVARSASRATAGSNTSAGAAVAAPAANGDDPVAAAEELLRDNQRRPSVQRAVSLKRGPSVSGGGATTPTATAADLPGAVAE